MDNLPEDAPAPRLCHLMKWRGFDGYGFYLHEDKSKPGQYIGKIDKDSPAESAGLKANDRILEVNETSISNESHKQVVHRITSIPNETKLLVVDEKTDQYYKARNIVVTGSMKNVSYRKTPVPRPKVVSRYPQPNLCRRVIKTREAAAYRRERRRICQANRRANETPEAVAYQRERNRIREANRRANETPEQREENNKKRRDRSRELYASLTPEERAEHLRRRKLQTRCSILIPTAVADQKERHRICEANRRANATPEAAADQRERRRIREANRRANETPEQREENNKKRRDRKREKYANLTHEERKLLLIQNREAARIKRALETQEEKEIQSALAKTTRENETPEERETRLFQEELLLSIQQEELEIRRSLINESIQVHLTTLQKSQPSTSSQILAVTALESAINENDKEPNYSSSKNLYSNKCSGSDNHEDSLDDSDLDEHEFKYDPCDTWSGWTETEKYDDDESEQKKRPDETLEQWTERLSRITENEYNRKVENISGTGRSCRQAATRAKARIRKLNESESTKQLRRSKQLTERRILNHQASKLQEKHLKIRKERAKLRKENETPQEAAKRRLIDAERARLKEKIENSKAERIAKLKLELELKKSVLANETSEERDSRITSEFLKTMTSGRWLNPPCNILTLEQKEAIALQRKQRKMECNRIRYEAKKAIEVETPELANARRANAAANARQRIRMEKEELRIYQDFNSAAEPNDLEELLDDVNTQNAIKFWYQYKSTKPHEQVILWRLNNYSMMIKKQKNSETETPEQKTERATKSFEQMKNLICSIGEIVLEYLKSKRNYFNNYFKKRWTELTEEQKNMHRDKMNAYIRRNYHKKKFGVDIGLGDYVRKRERNCQSAKVPEKEKRTPKKTASKTVNTSTSIEVVKPAHCSAKGLARSLKAIIDTGVHTPEAPADYDHEEEISNEDGWMPLATFEIDSVLPNEVLDLQDRVQQNSGFSNTIPQSNTFVENYAAMQAQLHVPNSQVYRPFQNQSSSIPWNLKSIPQNTELVQSGGLQLNYSMQFLPNSQVNLISQMPPVPIYQQPAVPISANENLQHAPTQPLTTTKSVVLTHGRHSCKVCSKVVPQSKNLVEHIWTEHYLQREIQFKCPFCDAAGLKYSSSLATHINEFHPSESETYVFGINQSKLATAKKYQCNSCSDNFDSFFKLNEHVSSIHGKLKYNCTVCGICLSTLMHLADHIQFFHSEHLNISMDSNNYQPKDMDMKNLPKCPTCQSYFLTEDFLTKHKTVGHGKIEEKERKRKNKKTKSKYECSACSAPFDNKMSMLVHLISCTDRTVLNCYWCTKVFTSEDVRQNHFKINHPKKLINNEMLYRPYKCELCCHNYYTTLFLRLHYNYCHLGVREKFKKIYHTKTDPASATENQTRGSKSNNSGDPWNNEPIQLLSQPEDWTSLNNNIKKKLSLAEVCKLIKEIKKQSAKRKHSKERNSKKNPKTKKRKKLSNLDSEKKNRSSASESDESNPEESDQGGFSDDNNKESDSEGQISNKQKHVSLKDVIIKPKQISKRTKTKSSNPPQSKRTVTKSKFSKGLKSNASDEDSESRPRSLKKQKILKQPDSSDTDSSNENLIPEKDSHKKPKSSHRLKLVKDVISHNKATKKKTRSRPKSLRKLELDDSDPDFVPDSKSLLFSKRSLRKPKSKFSKLSDNSDVSEEDSDENFILENESSPKTASNKTKSRTSQPLKLDDLNKYSKTKNRFRLQKSSKNLKYESDQDLLESTSNDESNRSEKPKFDGTRIAVLALERCDSMLQSLKPSPCLTECSDANKSSAAENDDVSSTFQEDTCTRSDNTQHPDTS